MNDITSLATKIEAAKLAGNGITLSNEELTGFLKLAALLGGGSPIVTNNHAITTSERFVDDPDELVTIEEVCAKLKITRSTLFRWRASGKFKPEPVNLQGTRWLRRDLAQWLQERQV